MIHINLLPPDIRKDAEKKFVVSRNAIPLEIIVGSIGGVLIVLVLMHVVLVSLSLKRLTVFKMREQHAKTLETRRSFVEGITTRLRELKAEEGEIKKIFNESFYEWARTLNIVSATLPRGVWFVKVSVDAEEINLQGSAVARDMDEIVAVHNYVNKLRTDSFLKTRFIDFAQDAVQKRRTSKMNVADFTIRSKIHPVTAGRKLEVENALRTAQNGRTVFSEALPGVPEQAKKNMQVTDRKPSVDTGQ